MISRSTAFRYSFVTIILPTAGIVWVWTRVVSKRMTSVVHFRHGTDTITTPNPANRYLKIADGKPVGCKAAVLQQHILSGYGLGYSARVYGANSEHTFWSSCRASGQHCHESSAGESSFGESENYDRSIRGACRDYSVATQNPKPTSLVFTTIDPLGNEVKLYTATWNDHIVIGHVEMVGLDGLVRQAVEEPDQIRQSTIHPTAYRFEFTNSSTQIGVIITYGGPVLSGAEMGKVTTAYPINPRYTSNVGTIIWNNPKKKVGP